VAQDGLVVVVGGTSGLGMAIARHYHEAGRSVVLTGRSMTSAQAVARDLGTRASAAAFDLSQPETIAPALADVGPVQYLVLAAIERDDNSVRAYDMARAIRLTTLKLVGYTEVVHSLCDRLTDDGSVLVFGGLAKDRPYPGSTTVSTINGGVLGLVRSLAHELAPLRVNSLHPAFVADSPYWIGKDEFLEIRRARTLTRRLPVMSDLVGAAAFLLENPSVNGVDLAVDGGWIIN
jgi:NAD(P)-dependent dehydrogenase (short-subunit alcohol dehydrogenase family)